MIELPKNFLYNTAIKARRKNSAPSIRKMGGIYSGNGLKVFQHDICSGIHPAFHEAEAIYTEPAWNNGYGVFTEHTIAENTTWTDYAKAIDYVCHTLKIPAFIFAGKHFLRILRPHLVKQVCFDFHHDPTSCLMVYNYIDDLSSLNNEKEVKDFVAKTFNTVLDFSCGYGTIAYYLQGYGKKGILCDVNADCLQYVISHFIDEKGRAV